MKRATHLFPIIVFQAYLWGTVLLFAIGPWPWNVPDPLRLYAFLAICHVALLLGYLRAVRCPSQEKHALYPSRRFTWFFLIVALLWTLPKYWIRLSVVTFDPAYLIHSIWSGTMEPALAYRQRHTEVSGDIQDVWLSYANLLFAPVAYAAIPLGLFYWRRLSTSQRVVHGLVWLADVSSWLAIGTCKGVFDAVIISAWVVLAGHPELVDRSRVRRGIGSARPPVSRRVVIAIVAALCITLAMTYFTMANVGRRESSYDYDQGTGSYVNRSSPVLMLTPKSLHPTVISMSSYLTQGYYLLGLALQEPFVPCYGVGNSYFLTRITRHVFGPDYISDRSYPGRIERKYGEDRLVNWHSFYVWMASDVSFPGVVVIVYVIGWVLGQTWMDCLYARHYAAVVLFALSCTIVYYLPANNQVFGFSEGALAFGLFFWCWWRWRRRRVPKSCDWDGLYCQKRTAPALRTGSQRLGVNATRVISGF